MKHDNICMKRYSILILFALAAVAFLALVTSCAGMPTTPDPAPSPTPTATPAPSASIPLPWDGKHKDSAKWTAHLLATINASTLPDQMPTDLMAYCPKYKTMSRPERRDVWANLISRMTLHESSFNPAAKYTESFKDQHGNYVVSRGLLQISQESANSYGCGIDPAEELHDPIINLSCGVDIVDTWVGRDKTAMGVISNYKSGCGRYWSVCRTTSGSYAKIVAYMKGLPRCI